MSEYSSASSGALKLKGSSGVDKKKKKKKPKPPADSNDAPRSSKDGEPEARTSKKDLQKILEEEDDDEAGREDAVKEFEKFKEHGGKTEAERRHEERRRQRLEERLRREGVKTHKERVEELNRYLSKLSEHHDMPRIGPG